MSKVRTGRPRAGEGHDIEPRILDRAWQLFSAGGYTAITYEALSRLEHMSKQTIYSRFENKEALFRAAADRQIEVWSEQTRHAIKTAAGNPFAASVAAMFQILMDPSLVALSHLLHRGDIDDPELRRMLQKSTTGTLNNLAKLIVATHPPISLPEASLASECILAMLTGHASVASVLKGRARAEHMELWTPRMTTMAARMVATTPPLISQDQPADLIETS